MATFTLDDIRAAADRKFGGMTIPLSDGTNVEMKNVIRMDKGHRDRVKNAQSAFDEISGRDDVDEDELIEAVRTLIRAIVSNDHYTDRLFDELGQDSGLILTVLTSYAGGGEVGEELGEA